MTRARRRHRGPNRKVRVTGGTTTITPSALNQFLTTNGIGVSAIAPVTISNGAVTLPVRGAFRATFVRLARLSNVVRGGNSVTANRVLSQQAARYIDRLAGKQVVSAGANLGRLHTVVTTP